MHLVNLIHYHLSLVLTDKFQQVKVNGFLFDAFPVTSGVPQGTLISVTDCYLYYSYKH